MIDVTVGDTIVEVGDGDTVTLVDGQPVEVAGGELISTGDGVSVPSARLLPTPLGEPGQVAAVNDAGTATEWVDPATGAVGSVNGQTGVVVLDADDVGAASPPLVMLAESDGTVTPVPATPGNVVVAVKPFDGGVPLVQVAEPSGSGQKVSLVPTEWNLTGYPGAAVFWEEDDITPATTANLSLAFSFGLSYPITINSTITIRTIIGAGSPVDTEIVMSGEYADITAALTGLAAGIVGVVSGWNVGVFGGGVAIYATAAGSASIEVLSVTGSDAFSLGLAGVTPTDGEDEIVGEEPVRRGVLRNTGGVGLLNATDDGATHTHPTNLIPVQQGVMLVDSVNTDGDPVWSVENWPPRLDHFQYLNTTSGLDAENPQAAIDELAAAIDALEVGGGAPLSDDDPEALGTADSGVSTSASRADHVHPMPTAADVGAITSSDLTTALASYQPLDADLTAIAALTTTSYGRALLEVANLAALQAILGTGTPSSSTFLRGDGAWAAPAVKAVPKYVSGGSPVNLDTSDQVIAQITLDNLAAGDVIEFAFTMTVANSAGSTRVYTPKVRLNSTTVLTFGAGSIPSGAPRRIRVTGKLACTGSNAQHLDASATINAASIEAQDGTATESNTAPVLAITLRNDALASQTATNLLATAMHMKV